MKKHNTLINEYTNTLMHKQFYTILYRITVEIWESLNFSIPNFLRYDFPAGSDFNPNQSNLSQSSPSKSPSKSSHFVMINCRRSIPSHQQRRSLDELSTITVSYDWKDVSQLTATHELGDTIVEVSWVLKIINLKNGINFLRNLILQIDRFKKLWD